MSKQTVGVGQQLVVRRTAYPPGWQLITVEKVTPTGRLVCSGGYTLDPDWRVRGASKWGPFWAQWPTDSILAEAAKKELLDKIHDVRPAEWEALNHNALQEIVNILEQERGVC